MPVPVPITLKALYELQTGMAAQLEGARDDIDKHGDALALLAVDVGAIRKALAPRQEPELLRPAPVPAAPPSPTPPKTLPPKRGPRPRAGVRLPGYTVVALSGLALLGALSVLSEAASHRNPGYPGALSAIWRGLSGGAQ